MKHSSGSVWRKIMQVDWSYTTKLPVTVCTDAIVCEEGTFGDNLLNLHSYRCVRCSENQLYIVFQGPRFGKGRSTEYSMTFSEDNGSTKANLHFLHELLGFPPFTSVQELDMFMLEKISALRCI